MAPRFIISKEKAALADAALFSFMAYQRWCNSKIIDAVEFDGFDG
jgi:hypothetical protein